jgi:hypothetical protein
MMYRCHVSVGILCRPARFLSAILCAVLPSIAAAAPAAPAVKTETIVGGLDNPVAVAVRASDRELFVSESGAGRVVRITPGNDPKPHAIVTGFPVGPSPDAADLRVGPLGLAFTSAGNLIVGSGGQGPGKDAVRMFVLPADNKPLTVDKAKKTLTVQSGNETKTGEGWFYGVAAAPYAIFATSRGDDAGGWISRSFLQPTFGISPEMLRDLRPFIESKRLVHAGGPTALTISKRGELVVGQAGNFDKTPDSMLSFYNPSNSKLLLNLPTGLLDIVGLAYSPRTGLLYAVDLAWANEKQGGLFRLDATQIDGTLGVKAVKITALDKPTSLCFAPDGTLYITTLGIPKPGSAEKPGQLLKIPSGL